MKIAVASDDGANISSHFGRTKGLVVFEVEDGKIKGREYRPNTFTGHARGLEGNHYHDHHGPILQALSDCEAVISHGMGIRMYEDLEKNGIKAFITKETQVEKAVELFLQGKLRSFPESACHH